MFGEGISHSGEIIDLGAEMGIIKKAVHGTAIMIPNSDKDVMQPNNALLIIRNWLKNWKH